MPEQSRWQYSQMDSAEIKPFIAYIGAPPDFARDTTQTLAGNTWWEVRQGHVEVRTVHGSLHAPPGSWIFIPQGLKRRQLMAKDTILTSLNFRAVWPNGRPILELDHPITCGTGREADGMEITRLARATCEIAGHGWGRLGKNFAERDFTFQTWLQMRCNFMAFVNALLGYAITHGGGAITGPLSGDTRLDVIVHSIRRNLHAGPLPYSEWRANLGIARAQIDRLALQHLGTTLRARRDVLLRDEIRHQLALGNLSAKELAAKYSFTDPAHFTRWVRRMMGHSPRELRVNAV